ncbi:MAG: hypothetical protein AAGK04_10260 [Planctomycetota bacterium]
MACLTKTLIRLGVVGALVGGGAVLVAGPDRVGALVHQAKSSVHSAIDGAIDDPVALRSQLRDLEAQYPGKIAEVRGDLAELQAQKAQLVRDLEVGQRVIALTEADLGELGALLTRAKEAQHSNGYRVVNVRFENRSMSVDQGFTRAANIRNTRDAHKAQVDDIHRDLGFLNEQEGRLTELLAQLEAERTEFQTQIWQLDRQVDAIARNERMIDMMEKRQRTIDEHSRYRVASLDQLQARFADMRAQQDARLQSLAISTGSNSYVEQAKISIDQDVERETIFDFEPTALPAFGEPDVIEIVPDAEEQPEITASR